MTESGLSIFARLAFLNKKKKKERKRKLKEKQCFFMSKFIVLEK